MTNPAKCHCGSISWERRIEESRFICASCKRPLWQPIETAPKNGIEFEGMLPDGAKVTCKWVCDDWTDGWTFEYGGCWLTLNQNNQPTHWMPLPEPPRE